MLGNGEGLDVRRTTSLLWGGTAVRLMPGLQNMSDRVGDNVVHENCVEGGAGLEDEMDVKIYTLAQGV